MTNPQEVLLCESCNVPLCPLTKNDAPTMHCCIVKWMPITTETDTHFTRLLLRIVIILIGDGYMANNVVKKYHVVKAIMIRGRLLLELPCHCHKINLSNHEQLRCLDYDAFAHHARQLEQRAASIKDDLHFWFYGGSGGCLEDSGY